MGYSFILKDKNRKLKLKEEKILIYYDLPILFVCTDDNNVKYLVLCTDSENLQYIIISISKDCLLDMLNKRISAYDIFTNAKEKWRVTPAENIEDDKIEILDNFKEDELPKKNVYYKIFDKAVKDYKENLELECNSSEVLDYLYSEINISKKIAYKVVFSSYVNSSLLDLQNKEKKTKFHNRINFMENFFRLFFSNYELKEKTDEYHHSFSFQGMALKYQGW